MKAPLICLLLVGCATTGKYEEVLQSWVGKPELALVRSWGAPQGVYEASGTKILTYTSSRSITTGGIAPTYKTTIVGNTAYTRASGGMPGQQIGLWCNTSFEVRDGVVIHWNWEGNDCASN